MGMARSFPGLQRYWNSASAVRSVCSRRAIAPTCSANSCGDARFIFGLGGKAYCRDAGSSTSAVGVADCVALLTLASCITPNSIVANSTAGASAVTYSGTGTLTLSGANTFTGGLYINSGTVSGTVADAFGGTGTGTVHLGGSGSGGGVNSVTAFYPLVPAKGGTQNWFPLARE